ncbi:MAG: hypothetical protein WC976_06140 [Caldisericia bacterium]
MKKTYQGNCISITEDPDLDIDATELAQLVENSVYVNEEVFLQSCDALPEHLKIENQIFGFNKDKDVYFIYDTDTDIHYFYW